MKALVSSIFLGSASLLAAADCQIFGLGTLAAFSAYVHSEAKDNRGRIRPESATAMLSLLALIFGCPRRNH